MKILLISHSSKNAGAEKSFIETIIALSIKGHTLFAIFPKEGELINECKLYLKGYKIINQPSWVMKNPERLNWKGRLEIVLTSIISIIKNCGFIINNNPNIIITNTLASPCGAISSKMLFKKHIWHIREFMKEDHGVDYVFGANKSLQLVKDCSHKIICNSNIIKQTYQNILKTNNLYVAYQPVIVKNKKELLKKSENEESLNLLFLGRFLESKNQFEAVKAMLFLKDKNIKLRLVGALNNQYTENIKTFIQENNLKDCIEINNTVEDIVPVFANADVALVCSRCEAFGRVTIEAMKMGLPVIASNTGANPELINDGFNGYLYELGSPKDLANKILLMQNSKKREEMAENAYAWATDRFTIENYSNELQEILVRRV